MYILLLILCKGDVSIVQQVYSVMSLIREKTAVASDVIKIQQVIFLMINYALKKRPHSSDLIARMNLNDALKMLYLDNV